MHQEPKECASYKADENVVLGLLVQDEKTNKTVLDCLHKLYAEACIPWLIKIAGGRSSGENAVHNAHQAFHDSLLAIHHCITKQQFTPDGRPNSSRRFLYFVSLRYYKKLLVNKHQNYVETQNEDTSVFPKPQFVFPGEKKEKTRKLREIIKNMPERCRDILWLKYVEGDITEEIEKKMKMNEDQVHRRLFDCREKLKPFINGFNEKY